VEDGEYSFPAGRAVETVSINLIDRSDRTWAVSWPSERPGEQLMDSIGRIGVMRPLWVMEKDDGLVVVDGFRRLAVAVKLGLENVPAVKIEGNRAPREIFLARCFDLAGRLSVVEASRLVKILRERFGCSEDELTKNFLPLWGLGGSKGVLKKLRELERLQEPVARWCVENGVGLRDAARWAAFPREGQRGMLVLVRTFKPGANLLRKYLDLAGEISVRENVSVEEILSDSRIRKLLLDPQAAASGGRETVHRVLLERRYPELNKLEERLKELTAELDLAGSIQLDAPRLFEGNSYGASFEFGSPEELEQTALRLLDAARSGRAGGLFHLLGAPKTGGESGR
jgi:hypothetical protein